MNDSIPANAFTSLVAIDYVIVAAYLIGVLLVGLWFTKFVQTTGDFFLAGKALPFWAVGVSIVASDIGAIDLITGSGGAYKYGIAQANFDWIGSMPAVLIAAFVFVPYYWRAGVYTIPEFLGLRYNLAVRWIEAAIWLAFMATNVSIMLWTASVFLTSVLGWNTYAAIWLTALAVGIYTVSGGLAAVVMTDVMQVVVMLVGAGALVVLSMWEVGGWSGLTEKVLAQPGTTEDYFRLLLPHSAPTEYPWTGIVFGLGLVMSTAYFVGNQAVLQRALGSRSEWDAKAGLVVAGGLKLLIPLLMFVPGLVARALYPGLERPDSAVPTLVNELLPSGLKGLMFAAFFAALMSSVDSYLNSCVTVFVSDIYSKVFWWTAGKNVSDRHTLILGRVLTVLLLVAAGLGAPLIGKFDTIYVALQTILSLFQGPTLAILLLGILWRRATGWGALAGLIVGVLTTALFNILGSAVFPSSRPFLFASFWSFVVSIAVTVVVSWLTPPEPLEKLRGLVYGLVVQDDAAQALLKERLDTP